jgi:hypothetical protein
MISIERSVPDFPIFFPRRKALGKLAWLFIISDKSNSWLLIGSLAQREEGGRPLFFLPYLEVSSVPNRELLATK